MTRIERKNRIKKLLSQTSRDCFPNNTETRIFDFIVRVVDYLIAICFECTVFYELELFVSKLLSIKKVLRLFSENFTFLYDFFAVW